MRPLLLSCLLAACSAHHTPPEPPTPPTPPTPPVAMSVATIYLVSAEGAPGSTPMGCGESMTPVSLEISSGTPREEAQGALNALLNAEDREGLSNPARGVFTAQIEEQDGGLVVALSGEPSFGGVCAVPRLKAPIEATLAPYSAKIQLNGSEADWRCLGDQSGECK